MPRPPPSPTLFPTRRSSDLSRLLEERERIEALIQEVGDLYARMRIGAVGRYQWDRRGADLLHEALRSEEHTSELQSHHDLVCRLLLEKKKNIKDSRNNQP